jgi:beta-glucanase (GH16 family)
MQFEADGERPENFNPAHSASVAASAGAAEERAELEWVLAHPEISRSANLVRFLSFICAKYFEGAADEIREHSIATEALGRKRSNFDSHSDPIVRVIARTLRKKLDAIYSTDGQSRPLRIVLPVGHYVPEFVRPASSSAGATVFNEPAQASAAELSEELDLGDSAELLAVEKTAARLPVRWVKWWKPALAALIIPAIFLAGFLIGRRQDHAPHIVGEGFNWGAPAWTDEFDGAVGQPPDATKWAFDLAQPEGASQHDRRVYCSPRGGGAAECDSRQPNAFLDGSGHLVLRAQKTSAGVWTMARINTKGLKDFQYGRIEARMKMPVGAGLWPSFIIFGSNVDTVRWPVSGSIDVAENVALTANSNGLGPTMIRSTLHGPRYFGSNGLWHDFRLPNGARVDDGAFHTYGIIWSPGMVQFYVDDPANVYFVHDASDVPEGGAWVFDHPFCLQLSLAVGGDWAGDTDGKTPNPADLLIDYVRVYRIPPVHAPTIAFQPVTVKAGTAVASIVSLHAPDYAGRVRLACSTDVSTVSCSLATSVLNFSDTLSQEDTLTLSTSSFAENGRVVAPPGHYKVTIAATTISGDHSQLTVPFNVRNGD